MCHRVHATGKYDLSSTKNSKKFRKKYFYLPNKVYQFTMQNYYDFIFKSCANEKYIIQGLFQKTRVCVRYNEKRAGKIMERAQL